MIVAICIKTLIQTKKPYNIFYLPNFPPTTAATEQCKLWCPSISFIVLNTQEYFYVVV